MLDRIDELGEVQHKQCELSRLEQLQYTRRRYAIVRKWLIDSVNDLNVSIRHLTCEIEKLEGARNKHSTK